MNIESLLAEFKKRMHITFDIDDDNLKGLLKRSFFAIKSWCGEFDLDTNEYGKMLVIEHARYAFNEDTEFFIENFKEDLQSFSYELAKGETDGE